MKVAVITGATSGIGLAAAKLFIEKGYKVYGVARKSYEGEFYCYSADVTDYGAMQSVFADIFAREGKIDVLVNNAGFGVAGATEDLSPEKVRSEIDVNLTATAVLCGMIIPYMKGRGGKIINVSSVGGIVPLPYQAVYSASKAGVETFSRALANEVKNYKIRVTAVLPGDTKTGFTEARVTQGENERALKSVKKMARDEQHGAPPEKVAKIIYKCASKKRPPLRVSVG
ncbi:MAG: SDR family NAD(P)-dependent oxidoreductase, partial [Clostridia bacterium]|nr:SDR family NAD(P)-dependent oxidoreductase [Clostridia bacterium]